MRDIKFRAWFPFTKEILPLLSVDWRTGFVSSPGRSGSLNEGVILMQFTGLKDKNGKEIYEGDILKWDIVNDIDVVEWMAGDACYKDILNGLDSASCKYYEIIGNVYENSELLK